MTRTMDSAACVAVDTRARVAHAVRTEVEDLGSGHARPSASPSEQPLWLERSLKPPARCAPR